MYADWVRGFCVPVLLIVFGGIALAHAAQIGATFGPLLLAICLVAYGILRLRYFYRTRRPDKREQ